MVTIVLLGTGTPNPDPARAGSAVAVTDDDRWVLVDCGRAATHRVLEAGLDLARLDAVFITHHHSDHVSDLATLAIARWVGGAGGPLTVIAPDGPSARYAEHCLDVFRQQSFHSQAPASAGPRPVIVTRTFDASDAVTTVHSNGPWTVEAVLVDHHPVAPAVGYLVRHGELRMAISGDTAACDGMRHLAERADVLIHEALLADAVHPRLLDWNASRVGGGRAGPFSRRRATGAHPRDPTTELRRRTPALHRRREVGRVYRAGPGGRRSRPCGTHEPAVSSWAEA